MTLASPPSRASAASDNALAPPSPGQTWSLVYEGWDPAAEGRREALCALGNGYITTRGAAPWARADGVRYPGVYLAGGYNRLQTRIGDHLVETEDLVNLPNWLNLELRLGGNRWFDERCVRLLSYVQRLHLRRGMLIRAMRVEDDEGRRTMLSERRFVSMTDMHIAALEVSIRAENWSGTVDIRSGIEGRVVNAGAKLYAKFNNRHLEPLSAEVVDDETVQLLVRTTESNLHVAEAVRTRVFRGGELVTAAGRRALLEPGYVAQDFEASIAAGETLRIEKLAAIYTSRDAAISEPRAASRRSIERAGSFEATRVVHALTWRHLWRRFDVRLRTSKPLPQNLPMLLRLNIFHLLQAASLNSIGLDIGMPARGCTGEAYQGHVFWDEMFIFPTVVVRQPEIVRSLLMYRYRRLPEARAAAARAGYAGAMFPWQSGSDGEEQTQQVNLNPRSLRWVPDNSFRQRHVGSAIAWNVWQYVHVTEDREFLQFYGAELLLEIARFWASIAEYNAERGRYEIRGVMGPDEFHESYPGAPTPGINNNAYTNVMATWVLCRALDVLAMLPDIRRGEITSRLRLSAAETTRWEHISRHMFIPFHGEGIISQFEGYERLQELDWQAYRERYGDIHRLELILEAENDTANRYKVSKQADVLMLFYLFSAAELSEIFARLGYPFEPRSIPRIVDYYNRRCTHGSTLSRVVHAWVLARSDRPQALACFEQALLSDVRDIQGGTAAEGVHLGAMAGSVDLVQRVCTGIETTWGEALRLNPQLPEGLDRLDMCIRYRGHTIDVRLTHETVRLCGRETGPAPIRLTVWNEEHVFSGGCTCTFRHPAP